ncbi:MULTISPECIES: TrbJ/VirB5 family protein [Enterobacterales]|uniref:Type IV secretion system protein n=1 Tax=Citrobacter freundii TaxID=546 RepID=A0AA44NG99_CITFR|nr:MULTISPECIES: type IV secretion system protein [Citrobacter freundii complex]EKN6275829.1 type IV secretion system protein VirB5 [Yersinia enterocolitica]HDT2136552.1 type IV secretion system protein [Enterobacter roggenkampii]EKN6284691.1 type IV secretion system protein VirB5 [Yersinia enterocolitica]ELW8194794.1 type IV secretion system protein [Yersinia enterocolitica]ELY5205372.1 type IV secretion system protein [Yersinia enterocolitica]
MKMKTLAAACMAGALLCPSFAGATGIPVVDAMSNLEQVNEWAQHLEQWQSTVKQYESQLNAYKSQLATATGVRNVQDFLSQAKGLSSDLKNLQQNGISLNDLLTNSGGSYSSALNSLYSKYKMFDTCDATQTQSYADTCKQIVINRAVAVEDTTAVQEKINSTVSDIATLASRVEMSQDAKESQDLANTITSKSVQLNALTTQWEMSVKQSELRDQMLTSQRQKAHRQQQLSAPVADLNNL